MTIRGMKRLTPDECGERSGNRSFGRVVVHYGNVLTALPVCYAMIGGDVAFRTDPGRKLGAAVLGTKVAFEIDDAHDGWSVVVTGRQLVAGWVSHA